MSAFPGFLPVVAGKNYSSCSSYLVYWVFEGKSCSKIQHFLRCKRSGFRTNVSSPETHKLVLQPITHPGPGYLATSPHPKKVIISRVGIMILFVRIETIEIFMKPLASFDDIPTSFVGKLHTHSWWKHQHDWVLKKDAPKFGGFENHVRQITIWHLLWHSFWHSIHDILNAIWYSLWHSLWHVFRSRCGSQHPELVRWSSGSDVAHSIRSWRYGVRVQAWPTGCGARHMARKDTADIRRSRSRRKRKRMKEEKEEESHLC